MDFELYINWGVVGIIVLIALVIALPHGARVCI